MCIVKYNEISICEVAAKFAQVRLKRVQRREGDLRKRMLNVVAAYNVALEGHEARTQAVAEKTKMIIAR